MHRCQLSSSDLIYFKSIQVALAGSFYHSTFQDGSFLPNIWGDLFWLRVISRTQNTPGPSPGIQKWSDGETHRLMRGRGAHWGLATPSPRWGPPLRKYLNFERFYFYVRFNVVFSFVTTVWDPIYVTFSGHEFLLERLVLGILLNSDTSYSLWIIEALYALR